MTPTPPGSVSPGGTDPAGVDEAARLVPSSGRFVMAVDGVDGAGKTTFADALARLLHRRGLVVERASVDGFHHPRAHRRAEGRTAAAVWSRHFDYATLRRELLDPWRAGPGASYRTAVHDVVTDRALDLSPQPVPDIGVLLVDGLFCQRPELEGCWDAVVFLNVPFAVSVARMAQRDGGSPDPDHPDQRRYADAQRHYLEACRPRERADLVVDER